MKAAISKRYDVAHELGCRASDHALDYVMYVPATAEEIEAIFAKGLAAEPLTEEEVLKYKTAFMQFVAGEYVRLGWAMQLHFGCKRDNNRAMFAKLGPDTGYDCISNYTPSGLPKTILYSLNPIDNTMIDTVMGCFQEAPTAGKIQNGSAWWFNDNEVGMREQLTALANEGVLGNFVGMLTDSRSFLSYPRHEYFRRVLCGLIGEWVEHGKHPNDEAVSADGLDHDDLAVPTGGLVAEVKEAIDEGAQEVALTELQDLLGCVLGQDIARVADLLERLVAQGIHMYLLRVSLVRPAQAACRSNGPRCCS